jgi:hypothetical protein
MKRRIRIGGSIFVVALLAVMFTTGGATIERTIFVSANDNILNYTEQIYWDEQTYNEEYTKFCNDKAKYVEDLSIAHLQSWQTNSYYHVNAANWLIAFVSRYEANEGSTYLVSIGCSVEGPQIGTEDKPYYAFEWLVKPIFGTTADLYAFHHSLSGKTLIYEGERDGIATSITLVFAQPITHCHYHVWYKK